MGTLTKSHKASLRPRFEPPTLEDALFAAEGFIDDRDQQIEFAAELMRQPVEAIQAKAEAYFKAQANRIAVPTARRPAATVVVEKRSSAPFAINRNAAPGFTFERKSAPSFVVENRAARRVLGMPRG